MGKCKGKGEACIKLEPSAGSMAAPEAGWVALQLLLFCFIWGGYAQLNLYII